MGKTRPFLKWAGNKYHCLIPLLTALPPADCLIEPFTGSGAVFMNTDYPRYLLAEGNPDLVNLFQIIQQDGLHFIRDCERFFCPENNSEARYYELRHAFNLSQNPHERAQLFLYLNRHGYNGLCRYNQKGGYNVPFGRYIKPYFPNEEMCLFHEKSQRATIMHSDFKDTIVSAEPGMVIYCDPPYAPRDQTSNFSAYTEKVFGEQEQIQLATLANEAANRGITVIISNHDTPFTRHHYRNAEIISFPVKRMISCQAGKRIIVQELLAVFR